MRLLGAGVLIAGLTSFSFASFGVKGSLGYAPGDRDDLVLDAQSFLGHQPGAVATEVTRDNLGWETGAFAELPLTNSLLTGFSAAYSHIGNTEENNSYTALGGGYFISEKVKNSHYSIPMTAYLKLRAKDSPISFWLGAGADYIHVKTHYEYNQTYLGQPDNRRGDFTGNKFAPHVALGSELFLTKFLSVALDLRYIFDGKVDALTGPFFSTTGGAQNSMLFLYRNFSDGSQYIDAGADNPSTPVRQYKQDLSGIRAFLGLRLYFAPGGY